ncbi:hypothetical protein ACLQ3K_22210 [Tsukamurella sp. DT100]|uniref:hypothetical protein n=1 Tax=Tsukamurella sp. DT100 TaxID=3393415 RepID=UPI003CF5D8DE
MTGPHLVGAVPSAELLPVDAEPAGVYLTRDDAAAHCWDSPAAPGGWAQMPWSPGCEQFFGLTPDQVPDLPGGTP